MVEIAVAAQDKFGVEIPDEEVKDLRRLRMRVFASNIT